MNTETPKRSRKEFLSTIDPKWCPGCGCFPILKSLTDMFALAGIPRENLAVISGIGCSSRTPYYLSTYGFHTIHGRAPTVALGLKLARPELSVWVTSGDGDALSIGGNHFLHLMRRNPGVKFLLFNNQIYGLTKGQASPTTGAGTKTKTTPFGAHDNPVRPLALALAAGATFVARVPDNDPALMTETFKAAAAHRGCAMVEILFNCVTFNDGTHALFTDKETRAAHSIRLAHGKPILFGPKNEFALRIRDGAIERVAVDGGEPPADALRHDEQREDPSLAFMLAMMDDPLAFGTLRRVEHAAYEEGFGSAAPAFDLAALLSGEDSWRVE